MPQSMLANHHQPLIAIQVPKRNMWKEVSAKIALRLRRKLNRPRPRLTKSTINSAPSTHRPTGRVASRAFNCIPRDVASPSTSGSFAPASAIFSGSAGPCSEFVTASEINPSNTIKCSKISAIDHRSAASRKPHCAGPNPSTSPSNRASLAASRSNKMTFLRSHHSSH